jgi:putative transposase
MKRPPATRAVVSKARPVRTELTLAGLAHCLQRERNATIPSRQIQESRSGRKIPLLVSEGTAEDKYRAICRKDAIFGTPQGSIVACDFFTVESVLLRRFYVLFFIAHASRRVWLAGCTTNPTGAWVAQQARNLGLDYSDQGARFLIRDRDSKYSGPFDEVFRSEGIRIVKTPVRAPKANAIAERFVRTVRSECLDWLLILNRRHLEHVLHTYIAHYNGHRPHRALDVRPPDRDEPAPPAEGDIQRHDRLGGLIHEYYRAAA